MGSAYTQLQSVDGNNSLSVQQIADKLENQRINELKTAALGMKGSLVQSGRCPKCTLKPPCKHYEKCEDLPSVMEVQPALLRKQQSPLATHIPPLHPFSSGQSTHSIPIKLPSQGRMDAEVTRFTTASSNYMNILSASTPGISTFQSSGAQILQGLPQSTKENLGPSQRLFSDPNNETPQGRGKKSPFKASSNKSTHLDPISTS